MASISFRNVTKRFGDTLALDDVSFDIRDNAFFCLFGPPLSGKSTILKLISTTASLAYRLITYTAFTTCNTIGYDVMQSLMYDNL